MFKRRVERDVYLCLRFGKFQGTNDNYTKYVRFVCSVGWRAGQRMIVVFVSQEGERTRD